MPDFSIKIFGTQGFVDFVEEIKKWTEIMTTSPVCSILASDVSMHEQVVIGGNVCNILAGDVSMHEEVMERVSEIEVSDD